MARPRARLDSVDHQLLSLLAQDARLKNKDLAERTGLAPSTCHVRVRRLERDGFIVGYRAIVARSGRGARVEGWADIHFKTLSPEQTRAFGKLLEAAPEIVEAHRITGHADFVVRFCGENMTAWNVFRERLDALGFEADARFNVLVEAFK